MKASDYVMRYLADEGVTHIFEVIGGMITHLIDSGARNPDITLVSCHHEQAAAFAAQGMAMIKGVPGVALATSGPGATNLLTGIGSCYFDSVPGIFITGQVNLHEQKNNKKIRQLGFQETDVVRMAKPITKKASMLRDADRLGGLLQESFRIALSDRPGPVLIDIPMDLQRATVDETHPKPVIRFVRDKNQTASIDELLKALKKAKRPLILVGGGVPASSTSPQVAELARLLDIPVVHSLMAVDVLPSDNPYRAGFIGSYGNRWANIALGTCDWLMVLGSRMDIRQTGADAEYFSRGRTIFHVDCESAEINNRIMGCVPIVSDLRRFLPELIEKVSTSKARYDHQAWLSEIADLKSKWSDLAEVKGFKGILPNHLVRDISHSADQAGAFVVDIGNHQMWAAQSVIIRSGQRFLTSGGMGAMGFSLPTAMGASLALPGKPIVQIVGDGSMQMNIQELQTVQHHQLPIKMVVINNGSLGMVRQFQQSYFHERYASTYEGYSCPDFEQVAAAYGINGTTVKSKAELKAGIKRMWLNPLQPFLLQVMIDPMINAYPKIAFGHPLTEMEPFVQPLEMEGT